jgi:Domain of unknown function (DUF4349)
MSATDRNELDGYESLVAELRADPPVAPERLRERVLERAPARRRRMSRKRRLVLVVVPVAVGLAVGAALVHGFVSSGSHPRAGNFPVLSGVGKGSVPKRAGRLLAPAHKATAGTTGQNSAVYSEHALSGQPLAIPKDRLVHADATLQVQVPSHSALSRATNKATQIVASLGGYAQSVRYQSSRQGYGNAFLSLRVPVGKAQTAIARLGGLGTLLSQQVSTKDLQQQLTHETNGIGSLRRAIAVYVQALQSGSLAAPQRVEIQIKLADARHALTQLRKARSGTVASGATADISLTLTTHKGAVVVTHHSSGRFDRLLDGAAGFLGLEGIVVLYALVVLSPLLVLGGLAWAFLRERRRRDERRLLASA